MTDNVLVDEHRCAVFFLRQAALALSLTEGERQRQTDRLFVNRQRCEWPNLSGNNNKTSYFHTIHTDIEMFSESTICSSFYGISP